MQHYLTQAPIRKSHGFTLVELLVGMSLSLVVLGAVLATYIPTLQSWQSTTDANDLYDVEVILGDLIGERIRQSGELGCGNFTSIDDRVVPLSGSRPDLSWLFAPTLPGSVPTSLRFLSNAFEAHDVDSSKIPTQYGSGVSGNHIAGDIFHTLAPAPGYERLQSISVIGAGTPQQTDIVFQNVAASVTMGDFYLIVNCDAPSLVRAAATTTGQLTFFDGGVDNVLANQNTVVHRLEPAVYFIGSIGSGTIPTLYKRTLSTTLNNGKLRQRNAPILTGIDNLRIELGVSTAGNRHIAQYLTAKVYAQDPTAYALRSVRMTAMLRAQRGSNSEASRQNTLMFPDSEGEDRDCYAANASTYPSACPSFIYNTSANRNIARKVIQFNFILPSPSTI